MSVRLAKFTAPKIVADEQIKKEEGLNDESPGDKKPNPKKQSVPAPSVPAAHIDWDKKIIKTADITLQLENYQKYNQALHAGLKMYGAYIASEEQDFNDEKAANEVTIKVPVDQFDDLIGSFSGEGIRVMQKKIASDDVTGEVVDTKSRMEAKKLTRDRYLELLKQAKNMKEVLQVQGEINSIQEEIESASGRVAYLTHASAYSTVHLHYYQPLHDVGAAPGFLKELGRNFQKGILVIRSIVLALATLWPLVTVFAVLLVWMRRRNTKPAAGPSA